MYGIEGQASPVDFVEMLPNPNRYTQRAAGQLSVAGDHTKPVVTTGVKEAFCFASRCLRSRPHASATFRGIRR